MSGIYRKATVYVQKMPAGRLEETEDGYRFAYFPEYCDREWFPVSSYGLRSTIMLRGSCG